MPAPSTEPLRKVTINLNDSDVEFFEAIYGRGWSANLRDLMREHAKAKGFREWLDRRRNG